MAGAPRFDYYPNWFYGVTTRRCNDVGTSIGWDNEPRSPLSRAFYCAILLFGVLAVVAMWAEVFGVAGNGYVHGGAGKKPRRRVCLDILRICCITCVVVEHTGGQSFSWKNTGFVLAWVLPFLFITSGICFQMSGQSLGCYIMRLSIIFPVGVGANWIADVATGRDWANNFSDTIFQMYYIVAVLAILLCPLKHMLKWRMAKPDAPAPIFFYVYSLVWLILVAFGCFLNTGYIPLRVQGATSWFNFYRSIFANMDAIAIEFGTPIFLTCIACSLTGALSSGLLGWLLLVIVFLSRILVPWDLNGQFHQVQLYMLGMVIEACPLRGAPTVAADIRTYWAFFFVIICFSGLPDTDGRCDLHPPGMTWERTRFYGINCFLTIALLSGALEMNDPQHVCVWLSQWALYAYCFHVAWHRLLPEPWGAVVTYLSIVPFYIFHFITSKQVREGRLVLPKPVLEVPLSPDGAVAGGPATDESVEEVELASRLADPAAPTNLV